MELLWHDSIGPSHVVPEEHQHKISQLKDDLRDCPTLEHKYQLCTATRDTLLPPTTLTDNQFSLPALLAGVYYENVMVQECPGIGDDPTWTTFCASIHKASSAAPKRIGCLRSVDRLWGRQVILHYGWEKQSAQFLQHLASAAKVCAKWADAVVKLNQLLNRRYIMSRGDQKCTIDQGPQPIKTTELKRLKDWADALRAGRDYPGPDQDAESFRRLGPLTAVRLVVLPDDFSLDKYELLVNQAPRPPLALRGTRRPAPIDSTLNAPPFRASKRQRLDRMDRVDRTDLPDASQERPHGPAAELLNRVRDGGPQSLAPTPTAQLLDRFEDGEVRQPGADPVVDSLPKSTGVPSPCRVPDRVKDEEFRKQVLAQLVIDRAPRGVEPETWGEANNQIVYDVLRVATHPNVDPAVGPVEAYFLDSDGAHERVASTNPACPIVVADKDDLRGYQSSRYSRPIEFVLSEVLTSNPDAEISVQKPSLNYKDDDPSLALKLSEVKDRFLAREPRKDPYNLLDFINPHGERAVPKFLSKGDANTLMLRQIKDQIIAPVPPKTAGRATVAPAKERQWVDILAWSLLSEGGNVTAPHTDSHGFATWITCQEGEIGFGWLSHPDADIMNRWTRCMGDDGGPYPTGDGVRWRFIVLRPGETVFFNSATVHFVFRPRGKTQTLAFGGHVLLWKGLTRWMKTLIWQVKNRLVTNEDMDDSGKYVTAARNLVANMVQQAAGGGRQLEVLIDEDGKPAVEVVREFDELIREFNLAMQWKFGKNVSVKAVAAGSQPSPTPKVTKAKAAPAVPTRQSRRLQDKAGSVRGGS